MATQMQPAPQLGVRLDQLLAGDPQPDEIDREIERTEKRLTVLKAMRGEEVSAALQAMREPKKPKAKPATAKVSRRLKARAGESAAVSLDPRKIDDLAFRAGAFLVREGPRRSDAIRNELKCSYLEMAEVLDRPWFEKDGVRIRLSSQGEAHFREAGRASA